MKPGAVLALLIALGSLAGSVALGLFNRSQPGPGVTLHLDREAYMTGGYREGDLRSVTLHQDTRRGALDQAKLAELGFRRRHHGSPLPRPAYVVLERDTLLTVIDAGPDAGMLARRYDNPSRFLILRGLVSAYYHMNEGRADGQVRGLLPARLYLPPGVGRDVPLRLHSGRLHLPFVTD
jgi:hypothetical protein